MASALSPNASVPRHLSAASRRTVLPATRPWGASTLPSPGGRIARRITALPPPSAGSRADDSSSAPFEMSMESALKVLGVSEGASFEDVLRAKNTILAACGDDQEAVARVEAAYDMLLMQSLTQRRAGKVASSNVRYADVKLVKTVLSSSLPQWLQSTVNNLPVAIDNPSAKNLGIEAGVYGALMVLTYANGSLPPAGLNSGADVPGLILATGFGVSLYFLSKKNVNLAAIQGGLDQSLGGTSLYESFFFPLFFPGKAALITAGGLVVGAAMGSAVESWLQVDIVPFFGIRSPAVVVSEFVLLSQFLVSLYLR